MPGLLPAERGRHGDHPAQKGDGIAPYVFEGTSASGPALPAYKAVCQGAAGADKGAEAGYDQRDHAALYAGTDADPGEKSKEAGE